MASCLSLPGCPSGAGLSAWLQLSRSWARRSVGLFVLSQPWARRSAELFFRCSCLVNVCRADNWESRHPSCLNVCESRHRACLVDKSRPDACSPCAPSLLVFFVSQQKGLKGLTSKPFSRFASENLTDGNNFWFAGRNSQTK